ncbi:SAM-dependent DNA methyltransferase, partial [bacterium]|nr:SAM-dependent DNA methyltransferase [bacterium]
NWLFQATYKKLREHLLKKTTWNITAKLGPRAFETISGEVDKAVLWSSTKSSNTIENMLSGIDASFCKSAKKKAQFLIVGKVECVSQSKVLEAPDSRVAFNIADDSKLMQAHATSIQGLATSDDPQFTIFFWELSDILDGWVQLRGTVRNTAHYGGCERLVFWENGKGRYFHHAMALKEEGRLGGWKSGTEARNNKGVIVSQMSSMPVSIYSGEFYDHNACVILPTNEDELPAIWTYCSSPYFSDEVRKIDQSLKPSNNTFVKIPFDLEYWQKLAAEKYPNGLPEPYSDDLTQWIFHGHPAKSKHVLQVAIARLLGYRWPAELDSEMGLADEQREWVNKCDGLLKYVDEDGIVCIPSVRGEETADGR